MAQVYVSLNRGVSGMKNSDFTTGAATTADDDIELRIQDDAGWTKEEVRRALKAFERWFMSKDNTTFPKL